MRHILIVDDEQFLAKNLRELLSGTMEWKPSIAYDAKEAIGIFSKAHFDVLLLDLDLPDMKGIELAQHLTKISPGVKIIYMSAYPEYIKNLKAAEGNQRSILEKPFDFFQLQDILKQIIN